MIKQLAGPGIVLIRSSHLETKGCITFTACGPNKARTWNRDLNGTLRQSEVEDLSELAVKEGYDRDFSLRMHEDDFKAYNNNFILVDEDSFTVDTVTTLAGEVGSVVE